MTETSVELAVRAGEVERTFRDLVDVLLWVEFNHRLISVDGDGQYDYPDRQLLWRLLEEGQNFCRHYRRGLLDEPVDLQLVDWQGATGSPLCSLLDQVAKFLGQHNECCGLSPLLSKGKLDYQRLNKRVAFLTRMEEMTLAEASDEAIRQHEVTTTSRILREAMLLLQYIAIRTPSKASAARALSVFEETRETIGALADPAMAGDEQALARAYQASRHMCSLLKDLLSECAPQRWSTAEVMNARGEVDMDKVAAVIASESQ